MGCSKFREGKTHFREVAMRSIGIDLHKRSMTVCVIDKTRGKTFVRKFSCGDEELLRNFFQAQQPFEAVIEASASYEWLWLLLEPLAERLVLAHPGKIRIIAESKKKNDRFDATVLAQILAQDEVPEAHRPTPRQREYQHLVRHRISLVRERSRFKTQIRSILASRNLDHPTLFSKLNLKTLQSLKLPEAERFRVGELLLLLESLKERIQAAEKQLQDYREEAPAEEQKKHEILRSVPGIGNVVADVILSTLGDVHRFPNIRKVSSYVGLAPGFRESDRKRKDLGITKQGPKILRWVIIEAAWRAIRESKRWKAIFEEIAGRRGRKKAVVAVGRRLLGVAYTLLKKEEVYVEAFPPRSSSLARTA
jgi:transposase